MTIETYPLEIASGGFVIVKNAKHAPFLIFKRGLDGEATGDYLATAWNLPTARAMCATLRGRERATDGKPDCGDRCD